jgi:Raf kinase inhibitor-like YbhB/YbcL family protein
MKAFLTALALAGLTSSASALELTSADLKDGGTIADVHVFNGFGCAGGNLSPALAWSNAPNDTKSFAVFVHDPDGQTGGAGFWHWALVDIPGSATGLESSLGGTKLPEGTKQVNTDFGAPGWGGPCPPAAEGAHRYVFTVYALPVEKLELPENPTASLAGFVVNSMAIGKASLTASYDRN